VTEQLHRLIDSGAEQSVINERIAALHERAFGEINAMRKDVSSQDVRLSKLERYVSMALGASALIVLVWEVVRSIIPHVKP
jgi:hypothetical protein